MRAMTSIDIRAALNEIKEQIIKGSVINIYDVAKKVYIIKCSNKDMKIFLLVEPGNRIHLTQFMRSKDSMPSGFTMKLRKHLKGKRINNIRQLGMDRVIDIVFGSGDYEHHLIIQFYVSGNIFLTDNQYKILTSLRQNVPEIKQSASNIYLIPDNLSDLFVNPDIVSIDVDNVKKFLKIGNYLITEIKRIIPYLNNSTIKQFIECNDQITDDNVEKCAECIVDVIGKFLDLLNGFKRVMNPGYITIQPNYINSNLDDIPATGIIDYSPFIPNAGINKCLIFNSYNECLDYYFGKFETFEKPTKKLSKADKIKIDQDRRIVNMKNQVEIAERNAYLIDKNSYLVDECISLMRTLISTGNKWDDIWEEIESQKQMGHEVALVFDKVDFKTGEIYLKLKDDSDEDTSFVVPISVNYSAFSNLREIHNMRKNILAKIDRTEDSAAIAIKNAEKKEKKLDNLKASKSSQIALVKVKKRFWFQKFKWFISSDDFLVLAGRDSMQNEILVKRYLENNDIYIHADVHGAASCIVKNNSTNPVPQRTLIEAGQFSVCNSAAWKSKYQTSAWWIESSQISKTPETGEYLPTGSFVIRGKKNFLPPSRLEMGMAIIYLNQMPAQNDLAESMAENIVDDKEIINSDNDKDANCDNGNEDVDYIISSVNSLEITQDVKSQNSTPAAEVKVDKSASVKKKGDGKVVRGQKSKNKRMKKYEDQDSDIDEIRMMLMGSKPVKSKQSNDATSNTITECSKSVRRPIIRSDKPFVKPPPFTTAIISKVSYTEEIIQSINESNYTTTDLADKDGEIVANETPFQCVSMCGPWEAISRYKLKVKLLPGNSKKSQIALEALHNFKKLENDEYRKNLLNQLKIDEMSLVIIENCKTVKA